MNIAVFCSSSNLIGEQHLETATELARYIVHCNHNLVYGGASKGLMEVIAQTCKNSTGYSGKIIGVLPGFLVENDLVSNHIDQEILVANLSERKSKLFKMSDVFVVLPGGFGTLDEMFEVLAHQQVTGLKKPVLLLDPHGFYVDLLAQVERMISEKFMPRSAKGFHVIDSAKEINEFI